MVNYNTSATARINNIITAADEDSNKNLMFSIGYDVYTNYYNSILRSSSLRAGQKYDIQSMYYNIITGLNANEEKELGIYQETDTDISASLTEYNNSLLQILILYFIAHFMITIISKRL